MPDLLISVRGQFAQFQDSLDKISRNTSRTVNQIEGAFRSLKSVTGVLGAFFGVREIVRFTGAIITAAEELNTISERTGVAVEDLAGLQFAAQQTGTSTEALAKGIKELDRAIIEMGSGADKQGKKLFDQLGLGDLASGASSGTEALLRLADVFPRLSSAQREFVAGKLGKSFFELIPALSGGRKELEGFIKEGQRLNPITKEMAKAADDFNDSLASLGVALKGALLPAFTPALKAITEFIQKLKEASQAAGGLFALLRSGVSLGDIDQGSKRIAELEQKIAGVVKQREKLEKFGGIGKFLSGEDAAREGALRNQLDILKKAQEQSLRQATQSAATGGGKGPIKLNLGAGAGAGTGADAATKAAKALLDKSLHEIEAAIDAERDLLSNRVEVLSSYYEADFLSAERFFQAKRDVIEEAVTNTISLYDEEIAALQEFSARADPKEQIEATTKIVDLIAQKQKAQADAAQRGIGLFFEETKAAQAYLDKVSEIRASLAEQAGDLREAAELRFTVANREITTQAFRAKDQAALGDIAAQRKFILAQVDINALKEQAAAINDNLATQERRLELEREFGASTELDALTKTSEARKQAVRDLESIVTSYEAVAAASGNPKLIQDAQQLRTSLDELALQTDLVAQKFRTLYDDAIADFFVDSITGTKDLSEAFNDMVNSIVRDIARIFIQQNISGPIAGALGGLTSQLFHSGGVAGQDRVPVRLHSGIGPNEYPAVLQRGEAVFTKGQQRALSENMSSSNVIVNVTPLSGETAQVRERQDGSGNINIDVMIERVIESKLGANISRGKGIAPMLERVYGLSRTPGMVR